MSRWVVYCERIPAKTLLIIAVVFLAGVLGTYKGSPHGMPTTEANTINDDLLTFLKA